MKYFKITDDGKETTSELLQKCRDKFQVWSYYDNDELDKQFPPPENQTTFFYKKTQEADKNLEDKSVNNLEKEGVKGITLRDRIIMELQYFEETGKHLDTENVTICSGSRYADGRVPRSDWGGGRFGVGRVSPGEACGHWRVREQFPEPLIIEPCYLGNKKTLSLEQRVQNLEDQMEKIKKFLILD